MFDDVLWMCKPTDGCKYSKNEFIHLLNVVYFCKFNEYWVMMQTDFFRRCNKSTARTISDVRL